MQNCFDMIGIGIGPSNLSLACLSDTVNIKSIFLDKKTKWSWHPGLQTKGSFLQVNFLKDLVTYIDPCNRFSFLNYLHKNNLLCKFLNRRDMEINRQEFDKYYSWVVNNLCTLNFDNNVIKIEYIKNIFYIHTNNKLYKTKNVVIGTGKKPNIPKMYKEHISEKVFHSSNYSNFLQKIKKSKGNKVLVIGGGQSGAEVVYDLMNLHLHDVHWCTRRDNFIPLEDTPFANEIHSPSYIDKFRTLQKEDKVKLIKKFKMTSDGISASLLNKIYEKLYEDTLYENKKNFLYIMSEVLDIQLQNNGRYKLNIRNNLFNTITRILDIDYIILATGYVPTFPDIFNILIDSTHSNNFEQSVIEIDDDYSIKNYFGDCKLFLHGTEAKHFGVSDANLSIIPWRSAVILNSIMKKELFNLKIDKYILG
jgi:lysine N6-hydroxylase